MDEEVIVTPTDSTEEVETTEGNTSQPEDVKTFTEEEVNKMIKDRLARSEKKAAEKIEEAAKLAKMNEAEKKEFEFNKMKTELEELQAKEATHVMGKEATAMLAEHSIVANEAILNIVVKDTADATTEAVETFVGIVNQTVEKQVIERLAGTTPKASTSEQEADVFAQKLKKYE